MRVSWYFRDSERSEHVLRVTTEPAVSDRDNVGVDTRMRPGDSRGIASGGRHSRRTPRETADQSGTGPKPFVTTDG